jgi:hypothetical protein
MCCLANQILLDVSEDVHYIVSGRSRTDKPLLPPRQSQALPLPPQLGQSPWPPHIDLEAQVVHEEYELFASKKTFGWRVMG